MRLQSRTLIVSSAALLSAGTAFAQSFQTQTSPTAPLGSYGQAVEGMPDVDGDGVPDYAVSGNGVTLGGNAAGSVAMYSGFNGAPIWTANGTGGWVPCGGGPGTAGDFFGMDMERVPDLDGDGLDDLAVGAPFYGVATGPCTSPFFGRTYVLSSQSGVVLATLTGANSRDFYGTKIKRIRDTTFNGTDDFLVLASGYFDIIDGGSGTLIRRFQLGIGDAAVAYAGDSNGDGLPWEIAIGNTITDQVRIVDVFIGTSTTIAGAMGSQFGYELEYVSAPAGGVEGVLIGAPQEAGSAGAVYLYDTTGALTQLSVGAAGDRLGSSLAYGGSGDLNMVPDDVLAGAPGGNYVRMLGLGGAQIRDIVQPGGSTFGDSVDWAGQIIPNGFDEILVGDTSAAMGGGQADLIYGGPAATLNQSFGGGCSSSGGAIPFAFQSGPLVVGGAYSVSLLGAAPFQNVQLFFGASSTTGIIVGPCTLWMSPSFGPFTAATGLTNFAGNWTSPALSIPLDPNLIGLSIAHQVGVVEPGGGFAFSNAMESTIGW